MKRTLVIGDIHGACKALEQVLKRAKASPQDHLIFLGDYVDGWSQSPEVIDLLIELEQSHNCIFIRGNHDTWCEIFLQTGAADPTWLFHGGRSTMTRYDRCDSVKKEKHLDFFNRMKNYYVDVNNNLFIHAGYSSMHGPEKEMYSSNYSWDRTLWEMALAMDKRIQKDSKSYPKRLKLFNEIYIGHAPTLHYDVEAPMNAINVWNLDTGVAYYGKLSIMDIETKQFWQSDPVSSLYREEKGRNND